MNINLFLMDGDANGCIKCTNINWVGVAYKIPRDKLNSLNNCSDLKYSGIYFLFGDSETDEPIVYIGQARVRKNGEGILYRLQEHNRNPKKNYWNEAFVITTSNNSLGATEISYLENRFCNLALSANRYIVKNGCEPSSGNITSEKANDLENFVIYVKAIMSALGYKVFTLKKVTNIEKVTPPPRKNGGSLILSRTIKQLGKTIEAFGKQTDEGFIVLKGSYISPIDDDTIPDTLKKQRKTAKINNDNILAEDILFSSPTYAAMFVIGKSANGLTSWKTPDGKTLKDTEN